LNIDRFFRKLPLWLKLSLIGIVPMLFFIYLSARYYVEKDRNAERFSEYIEQIQGNINISRLIDQLQLERKASFMKSLQINQSDSLTELQKRTDSLIKEIKANSSFTDFTTFTFLDSLAVVRSRIETGLRHEIIMHYYSTVIFRLGTLSNLSSLAGIYLKPVYQDLIGQRLLFDMANYLGILRSNIYNVLLTGQNALGTLYGSVGVYDIYKSYEKEFLLKAPTEAVRSYHRIRDSSVLNPVIRYINNRFTQMSFDSSYSANEWWKTSNLAVNELRDLADSHLNKAMTKLNQLYRKEIDIKNRALIFLIISLMIVIALVLYTIFIFTSIMNEMKLAAQRLARGKTGIQLSIDSRDAIGSLARSINLIDENNKLLADKATAIGKGDFAVDIQPRDPQDVLGIALREMKQDLQELTTQQKQRQQIIASAVLTAQEEERTRIGEELHDNVNQMLASVKLYMERMVEKKDIRDELLPMGIENISHAIREIRDLSHRLILPALRGNTLLESVNELLAGIRLVSPMKIYLEAKDFEEELLTEAQKIAIYRILQEQLNNILKYSSASTAAIHLKNRNGKFFLFIEDNGKGFDLEEKRKGVGLSNIINRAELLNGYVQIDTSPGNGCRLKVSLETSN
jgi:signal transduction histidine kinase